MSPNQIRQYQSTTKVQISIVMPIFNRLAYIDKSISSAQNQTMLNVEIICVDDCSDESVSTYILELMHYDKRIKLVQHMYRQGSFHARRNGAFTSKGEYIVSIDSDDFLYPNSIYPVYEYAKRVDADVVDYVAENVITTTNIVNDWLPCQMNFTSNNDLMWQYANKNLSYNVWKRMVKRTIYIKGMNFIYPFIKGKRLSCTEDVLVLCSIFLFAQNMYCTKFRVYVHFMSSQLSIDRGFLQPFHQNKNQARYTECVVRYLFLQKYKYSKNASFEDMLKEPKVHKYYNKIVNIDSSVIVKNCGIKIDEFEHFDFPEQGYCVVSCK